MESLHFAAERARRRRKIVVLDESCRIAYMQNGSQLEDRLFGFTSSIGEVPKAVASIVKRAFEQWDTPSGFTEVSAISPDGNAIRVFPMLEHGLRRVGVILERPKRRSRDLNV